MISGRDVSVGVRPYRLVGRLFPNNPVNRVLSLNQDDDWAYRVIRLVGNYADVFEHNLGPDTAVGLDRGINALFSEGGLLYSPPFR